MRQALFGFHPAEHFRPLGRICRYLTDAPPAQATHQARIQLFTRAESPRATGLAPVSPESVGYDARGAGWRGSSQRLAHRPMMDGRRRESTRGLRGGRIELPQLAAGIDEFVRKPLQL